MDLCSAEMQLKCSSPGREQTTRPLNHWGARVKLTERTHTEETVCWGSVDVKTDAGSSLDPVEVVGDRKGASEATIRAGGHWRPAPSHH